MKIEVTKYTAFNIGYGACLVIGCLTLIMDGFKQELNGWSFLDLYLFACGVHWLTGSKRKRLKKFGDLFIKGSITRDKNL